MNNLTGYLAAVCALALAEPATAQDTSLNHGEWSLMAGVVLSLATLNKVSVLSPRPSIEQLAQVRPVPVDDFKWFAAAAAADEA